MTKRRAKTIDIRQVLAVGLVALFSVVTVEHVARYLGSFEPAGEQWVGYVYAAGGDLAIAACALFTRWATTKRTAWAAYFALVGAECVFNVCYIAPWEKGIGAWVYSFYPTFIVAVLSLLQRDVDRLTGASSRASGALGALLRRVGIEPAQEAESKTETAGNNGKAEESGEEILARMSKKDRIIWLSKEREMESQARIAQLADCSEGYVSKVLARLQDSGKCGTIDAVTQAT